MTFILHTIRLSPLPASGLQQMVHVCYCRVGIDVAFDAQLESQLTGTVIAGRGCSTNKAAATQRNFSWKRVFVETTAKSKCSQGSTVIKANIQ